MKKLVIATALAVVAISSQAQVTIYGQVNEYINNTKIGGVGTTGLASDVSRIGFKVTEQLGSGLQARAVIETSILANNPTSSGTQLGDRQSTVGLAGKFGSVDLGRAAHSTFNTIAAIDPFGTLYGSVASDIHNLRGSRMSNAVFATIAPIAGVSLSVDRGTNSGENPYSIAASTSVAGLNISAAHYSNTVARAKSTVVGANTTFASTATQVFVSHSSNEDAGVTSTGTLIGVAQPLAGTPVTLKASYGRTNTDVTAYNLGASYALSKRTSVEATYRRVDAKLAANDVTQLGLGMRFAF